MTWTNGLLLIANLLVPGISACVYNEHPSQFLIGPGAARFPLSTEATEADCALIAYAFGYDGAAFGVHHSLAYNVHAWGHIGLRACIQNFSSRDWLRISRTALPSCDLGNISVLISWRLCHTQVWHDWCKWEANSWCHEHAGPSLGNGTSECTLHDVTDSCVQFELLYGAVSFTNITDCNAETAEAIKAESVGIDGTGQEFVSDGIVANKRSNVAAVGGVVGTPFKTASEADCLHACVTYVKGCSIVTTGAISTVLMQKTVVKRLIRTAHYMTLAKHRCLVCCSTHISAGDAITFAKSVQEYLWKTLLNAHFTTNL